MQAVPRSRTQLEEIEEESNAFLARFVRIASGSMSVMCVVVGAASVPVKLLDGFFGSLVGLLLFAGSYALTYRGDGLWGRRLFVHGFLVPALLGVLIADEAQIAPYSVMVGLALVFTAFLAARIDLVVSVVLSYAILVVLIAKSIRIHGLGLEHATTYITVTGLIGIQAIALALFTKNARRNQERLHTHITDIDRVVVHAGRIARGDLAGSVEGETDVSETIRTMLEGLRSLVIRARGAAAAMSSSARQIAAMARTQEQGAIEQASAVGQVHRTLAVLLEGSAQAAERVEEVFRNVEMTQKTSEVVAHRAAALSVHTRRISSILEIIKAIANKSEILALNAALEGARAGDAGRGFSLVASQMQRLAENVQDSVRDVRVLVEDIETATSATLSATDESTQLSARATAAARQISATLKQQRGSTEQVANAMRDIQHVASQATAGSGQSLAATQELTRLARELDQAIEGFQT